MTSIGSPSPFFLAGKKAYAVQRSLRFNDDDTAYLNRTPSGAGNRKKWTWSCWVKRSTVGSSKTLFMAGTNGVNDCEIYFSTDYFRFLNRTSGSANTLIDTNAFYRDVISWYHFVVVWDTAQSNADDRVKIYVNGTQVTSFSTNTRPSQNTDSHINNNIEHRVGARTTNNTDNFDGYMAEINFIDGQAYDPSYFGETNALTGQWNPKKYVGSYGTNGFYLNFSTNTLGTDRSGNSNDFTPNNFSVVAGAGNDALEDTPTNNFCTLNAIALGQGNEQRATLSNGNLDFTESSSSNRTAVSTFGLKTGKWYFEFLSTNTGTFSIGWHDMENNQGSFYRNNGSYSSSFGGGGASGYASWTTNDIVGVAIDFDSGKIWYAKNNTWQSGDPATGNSPTNTFTTGKTLHTEAFTDNSSGTKSGSFNFGQRAFSYTPPTGYKSICSANLPDPAINFPDKHFDTVLYTGDGNATGSQTNVLEFQPDWLWTKPRSAAYIHLLYDSIRGAGNSKSLNLAGGYTGDGAEGSGADNATYGFLNSFDANGFSYTRGSAATTYFNQSGVNYVVWNWNAGDTDGKTYAVTVVDDSGNKYRFDGFGTSAVTLDLAEGGTYVFDWSDSSAQGHPIRFSTTSDGTHGGGTEYTTGVVKDDSAYKTTITVAASAPTLYYYCQNHSGMGGAINTNSTLGSSNFDGNTQATVKANPTAGFSIISWNARGTSSGTYDTLGHGLGVRPDALLLKAVNSTGNWNVYFSNFGSDAYNKILQLSNTIAETTSSNYWGADNTTPSSTLIHLNQGNYSNNASPPKFIMYAFSAVEGYSKFGTYIGNGSSEGAFVFTGFRPAWIMIKISGYTGNWIIFDNKRDPFNYCNARLFPNLLNAETGSYNVISMLSNGFKLENQYDGSWNRNNTEFIYFAFAESPFKYARAR